MPHLLGYFAACLTVGSGVPQLLRILRTRDVHAISLWLYVMLFAGVLLWFAYGLAIHAWPVIIGNGISVMLTGWVLFLKIRLSKPA